MPFQARNWAMSNNNNGISNEKKIQYYSALVQAWLDTKIERDKSLLALSTAGIGLLITLLTTVGASSNYSIILYCIAIFCFLVCIIAVLIIFKRNAEHLKQVIKNKESTDPVLKKLDKISFISFILGILLSCILGISTGINSLPKSREAKMSKEKSANTMVNKGKKYEKKSFDGISDLKPGTQPPQNSQEGNQSTSSGSQQQSDGGSENKK